MNQEGDSQAEYLSLSPFQGCPGGDPGTLPLTFLKVEAESIEGPSLKFHSSKTSLQRGCSQPLEKWGRLVPALGQAPVSWVRSILRCRGPLVGRGHTAGGSGFKGDRGQDKLRDTGLF